MRKPLAIALVLGSSFAWGQSIGPPGGGGSAPVGPGTAIPVTALNQQTGGNTWLAYTSVSWAAVGQVIVGASIPDGNTITAINGNTPVNFTASNTFASAQKVILTANTTGLAVGLQCIDTTQANTIADGNTIASIVANTSVTFQNNMATTASATGDVIQCDPSVTLGSATTAAIPAGTGLTVYPNSSSVASPGSQLVNGGLTVGGSVLSSGFNLLPSQAVSVPQNGCPANYNGMILFFPGQIAFCVNGLVGGIITSTTIAVNRSANQAMELQAINTNNGNASGVGYVWRTSASGAGNDCDQFLQNGPSATTLLNGSSAFNLIYNLHNASGGSCTASNLFFANQASGSNVNVLELTSGSLVEWLNLGTDSGQAATATLCEDTTTHATYFGSGTAGACKGTSSLRFKERVAENYDGLNAVLAMRSVTYWNREGVGLDTSHELYGFLAEDMDKVLPRAVYHDDQGRPASIDYIGLLPVMAKAIQDLQAEIDELKAARQ